MTRCVWLWFMWKHVGNNCRIQCNFEAIPFWNVGSWSRSDFVIFLVKNDPSWKEILTLYTLLPPWLYVESESLWLCHLSFKTTHHKWSGVVFKVRVCSVSGVRFVVTVYRYSHRFHFWIFLYYTQEYKFQWSIPLRLYENKSIILKCARYIIKFMLLSF